MKINLLDKAPIIFFSRMSHDLHGTEGLWVTTTSQGKYHLPKAKLSRAEDRGT